MGLSPLNPEGAAITAGRLMLERMDHLLLKGIDFAFETTLATRSFVQFIEKAKDMGYVVTLVFIWLSDALIAIDRVKSRVKLGAHNIPKDVITRRYHRGIINFFDLYMSKVDRFVLLDNSSTIPELIAEMNIDKKVVIYDNAKFNRIQIWQK